jgi:hypothetical protein
MTRLLGLIALAALAFAPTAQAQVPFLGKLGVAVGANFDSYTDAEFNRDSDAPGNIDGATGYHIGLFYDLAIGPVGVRPGIYYVSLGDLEFDTIAGSVAGDAFSADLSLVEVPIDLRYRVITPLVQPYLSAGPVLRFANASDDNVNVKDFTVGGSVGVGVDLGIPFFSPFLEARYQFGLDGLVEDFEFGGASFSGEVEDGTQLNTFMIRLGVTF